MRTNSAQKSRTLAIAFGGLLAASQLAGAQTSSSGLVINEVDYDQPSTDAAEFIEIKNTGSTAVSLTNWVLELVNGTGGGAAVYSSISLSDVVLAAGDYYVVCGDAANVANCDLDVTPDTNLVQNGSPDAVGLRYSGSLIDTVSYEGDTGAPYTEGSGAGLEDVASSVAGSLSRCPDGVDTNQNNVDFFFASATPGESNACGVAPPPVINEFSASTTGTDVEYVEIYGVPSTDYSAYTVLEIEGDSTGAGVIDEVISLGETSANGLYLANLSANALENGTITLLLVKGFAGALGDDLDTDNDGIFDVIPWNVVVDAVAIDDGGADDRTYGVPALGPNYDGVSGFAPGGASRIPDGFDTDSATDWVRNDFDLAGIPEFSGTPTDGEAYNTPGALNAVYVPPAEACGDSYTPIYAIQGNGAASPLDGSGVATEGVVIGNFQDGKDGFFIQDDTGDGDSTTSDGIFVFYDATAVSVGDKVRVRGIVDEYFGLTEITNVSQVWLCSTGNSVTPTALSLPVNDVSDFEPYEGMLVTLPQTLYISEYFNFDRFGEIVLTTDRQYQPTALFEPGSQLAADWAESNSLTRITLDDGRGSSNPDPAIHPNGLEFTMENLFRGGDTVENVTGVLDYNFGMYKIQPTVGAIYTATNSRPSSPPEVGGSLKVASFNTLNYFTTIDDGVSDICGPLKNQECRGADTLEEFDRQQTKLVEALAAMDADIVGLIEIENHPENAPIDALVYALNVVVGADTYDYVPTGALGTDAIQQALIYKRESVSPLGEYAVLDSSVNPRFLDDKNRPTLAQTFQDVSTGGVFTVALNHFKSKGSACDDVGDPDMGDGAGNCNLTRKAAAEALVDWLSTDPTGSGDGDFLIIGDLNSYDMEDPIDVLIAGGYTDLLHKFEGEGAYTYLFDGQLGYLDYALANAGLMGEITGTTAWHINADEPDLIDYDTTFKQPPQAELYAPDAFRSSDHDPVIVGLSVCDEIPPTIEVSVTPDTLWPANHKYVNVTATVIASDNFDTSPTVTLESVTSSEPEDGDDDGNTLDDIVVVDDTTFQLRAERSGTGPGRTYTVTYSATDDCGNSTFVDATVFVPLSLGQ